MIRPLILIAQVLFGFLAAWFSNAPTAEVKAPSSAEPGTSFTVEVKINPNGVEDFMRYAMTLPEGWSAEEIKNDGATFLFQQQSARFVWSRVEGRKELNISFKVNVPANASGEVELTHKISHAVDNLPSHVPLTPIKIKVGSGTAANNTPSTVPTTSPTDTLEPAPTQVTAYRSITEIQKGEYLVGITLTKGEIKNFAKIQDSLPAGITARAEKKTGSDFEFKNGVVKFTWFQIPTANMINVQYVIVVDPDVDGVQTINGFFSYVEQDKGRLLNIEPTKFTVVANPALTQNTTPENTTSNNKTTSGNENTGNGNDAGNKTTNTTTSNSNTQPATNPVVTTPTNSGTGTTTTTTPTTTQNNPVTTTTPSTTTNTGNSNSNNSGNGSLSAGNKTSSSGVVYRVQIAAMSRRVPVSYYQSSYSISETINLEQIDGLHKYTVGNFNEYQSARDHRETVKNKGVQGPFVAAYSNGKRITVQEALMISSQKWVR
jgi:hypothetical protein